MAELRYTIAAVGPKIDSFLKLICADAGFELNYEIVEGKVLHPDFENPDILVRFSGEDVDLLLSNRAELLLALETVTMEALRMPQEDHSRLSFDANDYRMLRIEELRVSAEAAAEKVKRTGTPFRFNPMNSRERRVIHLALRNETTLRSESAGMGSYRHVVIYPAGMASLPDPPPPPPSRGGGPRDRDRDRRDSGRSGNRGRR